MFKIWFKSIPLGKSYFIFSASKIFWRTLWSVGSFHYSIGLIADLVTLSGLLCDADFNLLRRIHFDIPKDKLSLRP